MTSTIPPRVVSPTKLTDYLLNASHPVGGPKAAFFTAFGFLIATWPVMAAALVAHPERNAVEEVRRDRWGARYVVRCGVETPDGRNPCILSVWIVPSGHDEAQFVTAYPHKS